MFTYVVDFEIAVVVEASTAAEAKERAINFMMSITPNPKENKMVVMACRGVEIVD